MAWQPAANVGDTDPLIPEAKRKLAANSYGKSIGADRTATYTAEFGAALVQYGKNVHADVIAGKRPTPDVNVAGVFDWAIKKQMQLGQYAPPPPIKRRFPAYVFRGTGGIIGLDYVSQVCQANADLVEEINTPWAATMGGLPVGTAGNINDPSMWRGVQEALPLAQADFLRRLHDWPNMKVVIGGYSAGDIVAAYFEQWVKANYPDNFLCGFRFGSPTRPVGGGFFGQPAPWGNGIADVELGVVGDIMDDVYAAVTVFEFSDILGMVKQMVTVLPTVLQKAGIPLTGVLAAMSGGLPGIFGFGLVQMLAMLPGMIGGGDPDKLTGQAAAGKAAMIALEFLFGGTAPHIRYHVDPAWPGGPTFVDLARQHVRDWASRPENRALLT
jgi:hypothetical protein